MAWTLDYLESAQKSLRKMGRAEADRITRRLGEIAALEGGPRRANVRAVTDLEVFRIGRSDLQHVLADAPDVKAKLARAMKARLSLHPC